MATKQELLDEFAKQNEAIANIGADIDRILEGAGDNIPAEVLAAAKEQTAKLQDLAARNPEPETPPVEDGGNPPPQPTL